MSFGIFSTAIYDLALDKDTTSITGAPYIIPSLVASGTNIAAYILSNRYLSETLADKRASLDGYVIADISTYQMIISTKSNQIRIFGLKFSENSILLLFINSLFTLIYQGYSIISFDWSTMEMSKGGLNLKFDHIVAINIPFIIIVLIILYKYPYIHRKIGALNLFKVGFPAAGILFILSLIVSLIAKTGSKFIVLLLHAILNSTKTGAIILRGISFDLLIAESAEAHGNLGTLYGISNILSGAISLAVYYIFIIFSDLSIENNLPFPLNYSCTWLLCILSLFGYWLSSKIKSTA
jgi:hypothetical protein